MSRAPSSPDTTIPSPHLDTLPRSFMGESTEKWPPGVCSTSEDRRGEWSDLSELKLLGVWLRMGCMRTIAGEQLVLL